MAQADGVTVEHRDRLLVARNQAHVRVAWFIPGSVVLQELVLEVPRERPTSADSPMLDFARASEPVCSDFPSSPRAGSAERLDWHSTFTNVSDCPRCMCVAVVILKFLGSDVAMFEDVVNDGFWPLSRHFLTEGANAGIEVLIRRRRCNYPGSRRRAHLPTTVSILASA